jgi:hypothetical protein
MKQKNTAKINKPILDYATETEHADKVVSITKTQNAGGTDEQSIVDRYVLVKQNLASLKLKVQQVQNELQEIEEEAAAFAQDNSISILYGKDFIMNVIEEETIKYPLSTDPNRKELEALVRQTGIWERVSVMHLAKLQKYLRDNMFNKKIMDVFSRFATRVKKTKISLIPRVGIY